jgi:signal transduction histidine kinase
VTKNNTILIEELEAKVAELEKEKSSLLKIVSHDLRSPFNKLFALIGLFKMSDDELSSEQVDYLEKMELVISDALGKMRNLLDLRSIEGDGIDVLYESINLSKTISKLIIENEPATERKDLNIVFDAEPIVIETDKLSLIRVLDQLISNAIKYSPIKSEIKLTVEDNDDEVTIRITDGGYGISDKEQNDLFKKFMVLSSQTTGGESSLGLGLFIAQSMAKNIGATIEYDNRDGSTFIFRVPKTRLA